MAARNAKSAEKIVVKPTTLKFKTKSGRTVFLKAVKTVRKRASRDFRAAAK